MGHSSLDLTMNVYTGPGLLDVAAAPEVLPHLRLEDAWQPRTTEQAPAMVGPPGHLGLSTAQANRLSSAQQNPAFRSVAQEPAQCLASPAWPRKATRPPGGPSLGSVEPRAPSRLRT